ncbi:MAG TPA: Rieske (2Fe-2S) protein [Streptosporangiaceae bacterium]|nr:Rieske (2Fe-2S) protein [Streptosporangiaceae bacterium]
MAEPSVPASSRRTVLACAGAACAAVLAGCSRYNSNNGGVAGSQPAPATTTSAAAAPAGSGTAAAAAPAALASTSDIPVGGGKILTDKKIVITQPQSGAFHAFSAVCTHAGCTVGSVSGGTINCPCHGSRFNITTGAVVNGPAASPLPPVGIKVQGTSIVQA